ncbi:MAG TPA: tetratricopeptide repeat protein [Candidatus Methylacidiphilales bacterium]|nr:tetratricopeptide repeat protein [Candidatus Methylacidiphilales bacterium]
MKLTTFFFFILASVSGLPAQTILLKSGQTIPAEGFTRNADMLMATVKSSTEGTGQIGFHVADVASVNLPPPDALATANDLIAKGEYAQALAEIQPAVDFQKTIRDIPGNWWAQTAVVESSALLSLNREAEAMALVTEIEGYSKDPEVLSATKLLRTLTEKFADPQQAIAAYDALISQSSDPQTLSRAWIAEGDAHFTEHEFDEALMAYLTVTVFYPEHNPLLPKALWGAGQSYAKLKDDANAAKTYQNLISSYPGSPEASLAKAELLKKDKKT